MKGLKLIILMFCLTLSQVLLAHPSPIPMLEQISQDIIETLKDNKSSLKANPAIIYKAVNTNLVPHVDVLGMSRSVLGRQVWTKASAQQRVRFSESFTQLVIRTYATPLAEYSDETVQFLPLRGSLNDRFIRINSVIVRSTGRNIQLCYSLVFQDGQWKIYDMSIEGVSLLQSFRSQFAQVLQHADIEEVIKQMKQNNIKKG